MRKGRRSASSTSGRAAVILAIAVAIALAAISFGRPRLGQVWADEGTYLAMARSLAFDRDLRFDERDRLRIERQSEVEPGAGTVILQRDSSGTISYSKPALYPLLAAPFVALFGNAGAALLNALLLALALGVAYRFLRQRIEPGHAVLVLTTFTGAAVVVPYVFWRMGDTLQLVLGTIGLCTTLAPLRRSEKPTSGGPAAFDHPAWAAFGAACLGLLVPIRLNNLVLAVVPAVAYVLARRPRRAAALALCAALPALAGFGLTGWATGVANPYRAERTSFTAATGYPAGADAETAHAWFDDRPATHRTGIRPNAGLDRVGYSAIYFWIGRHTGLLWYFPAAIVLLLAALRRPDAAALAALAGFFGTVAFLVGWMPWNYFGGHTFLGNRYLLAAYPALLVAPRIPPRGRWLAAAWILAGVAYGSAWLSVHRSGDRDPSSQSHTHAGIFRLLPYESTARDLSSRDRYWADSFVRFVDPYPDLTAWDFEVRAGRPPAELILARWQAPGTVRFLVETDSPSATLVIDDRDQTRRFAVGRQERDGRPHSLVDIALTQPWRRHRFWWHEDQSYWVHTLRFGVEAEEASRIRVRLLGDPDTLASTYSAELVAVDGPDRGTPGGRGVYRLRIRNTSPRIWPAEDTVPVFARYRLRASVDGGGPATEGPPNRLPADVHPNDVTEVEVTVTWPDTPGRYTLDLDLVLARVSWFGDRAGAPLVRRTVDVTLDSPQGDG